MREVFVRRVAGLLVTLLLGVLLLSEHGVFRGTVARAMASGTTRDASVARSEPRRMLTAPFLSAEDVAALHRGEYSGPFSSGS